MSGETTEVIVVPVGQTVQHPELSNATTPNAAPLAAAVSSEAPGDTAPSSGETSDAASSTGEPSTRAPSAAAAETEVKKPFYQNFDPTLVRAPRARLPNHYR